MTLEMPRSYYDKNCSCHVDVHGNEIICEYCQKGNWNPTEHLDELWSEQK
jgi:hypothetical protein